MNVNLSVISPRHRYFFSRRRRRGRGEVTRDRGEARGDAARKKTKKNTKKRKKSKTADQIKTARGHNESRKIICEHTYSESCFF